MESHPNVRLHYNVQIAIKKLYNPKLVTRTTLEYRKSYHQHIISMAVAAATKALKQVGVSDKGQKTKRI